MPPNAHPPVKICDKLIQRLTAVSDTTMVGCLYGLPVIPPFKENAYYVWAATGKEKNMAQPQHPNGPPDLEVLTEVIPCGIDPLGLFVILQEEHAHLMDKINLLLEALPENFLNSTDPVILARIGPDTPLTAFLHSEGQLMPVEFETVTPEEIEKQVQFIRIKGRLTINCPQTEKDIQFSLRHLIEKVLCPYGTFHMMNSDVVFVHTWTTRKKFSGTGWAGNETLSTPDHEGCEVTNLDDEAETVGDLLRHLKQEEVIDDGFGPVPDKKKPKEVQEKETLNFRLLLKMSGEACSSKTLNCSPVFHYEKREFKNVTIPLKIDTIGVVRKTMKIPDIMELLKGTVQRQVHEMGRSVLSELKLRGSVSLPEVFHFKPEPVGHFCSFVYNRRGTCTNFSEFRKHFHKILLLPTDRPHFRRANAFQFQDDDVSQKALVNVHEGLKTGSTGGKVYLVQGKYSYHHYMQDKFDDDGWGCAYRSLQTIISWFRHQGYTGTEIPTHGQIQKCLVEMGDKDKKFLNSKQWIGSTEVGYVLEKSCDVQSKILSVSSGEELASKGRDLAHHFTTQGTPIMIGGGVLAHTILGVEWNEDTGDIKWLILDPHFTGNDWQGNGKPNTPHIQQKGWVGWKGPKFWKKDAFYNMCMPQRPKMW
ncbi:hypothetical protein TCAL_05479 [Tigriopus californicus]|uniref:Probable Ufm1-specific protease 2 n=1 Tax=Tigriopus californicus TaxID=6832 RepID=A0A553P761_TIGCA|nr:ufm1-specific protease 2-like [Tigriopus californicus]TRY73519.1 hypothetical protein TCAL_05479 [Tigriopus californicus]|eukprot:TCALIF_05479-PA protein Name:"Similar to UFSP2 Ufm1-specific protease 2 (Gallus gallus)" AED:0.03 eAED:0.03 QI:189/1/1/1/1/1/8/53/645